MMSPAFTRHSRRALLGSAAALALTAAFPVRAQRVNVVLSEHIEVTRFIDRETVELLKGRNSQVVRTGALFQDLTVVAVVDGEAPFAVLEDFSRLDGHMLIVDRNGVRHELPKSAETASTGGVAEPDTTANVAGSGAADPAYDQVAAMMPSIRRIDGDVYGQLFVPGTTQTVDFAWDGLTTGLDLAGFIPAVAQVREAGAVLAGRLGGYLPVLRFVYPEAGDAWTETLAFASLAAGPIHYRISRVEAGRRLWSRCYAGHGAGVATEEEGMAFYRELAALKAGCDALLAPAMKLDVPDERMMNQAKAGLLQALLSLAAGSDDSAAGLLAAWGLASADAPAPAAWNGQTVAGLALDANGAVTAEGTRSLAYGLIRQDRVGEALLTLYSAMANLATRGAWLGVDSRDPASDLASGASPAAQLTCPAVVRWLLAFEDPDAEVLWLGKGMPRAWTADMKFTFVDDVPTRWGRISYAVGSHRKDGRINVRVNYPDGGIAAQTRIRLRTHDKAAMKRVKVTTREGDKSWRDYDPVSETITLPAGMGGEVLIEVRY